MTAGPYFAPFCVGRDDFEVCGIAGQRAGTLCANAGRLLCIDLEQPSRPLIINGSNYLRSHHTQAALVTLV